MQIALNGLQNKHSLPYEFPYKAINPMTTKEETFNSKEDVYLVLEECYNKCIEKGYSRLGEALYKQSLFIANDIMFIDQGKIMANETVFEILAKLTGFGKADKGVRTLTKSTKKLATRLLGAAAAYKTFQFRFLYPIL